MSKPRPSICFIGSASHFSHSALTTLCAEDAGIAKIILAGHAPASLPARTLSVSQGKKNDEPHNQILQLAERLHLPVTFLGPRKHQDQHWQRVCAEAPPDYVFVACFPTKLPPMVLRWPRRHSINLHPSLLPRYRGPDPVYWQLRQGETQTGISLHILSEQWDAGPIIHQQRLPFPSQISRVALDRLLAQQGALAFARCVARGEFSATPQDERRATYQTHPRLGGEAGCKCR